MYGFIYFYTSVAIKGGGYGITTYGFRFFMECWIIWLSRFSMEKFSQNFSLLGFRLAVCIYGFPYFSCPPASQNLSLILNSSKSLNLPLLHWVPLPSPCPSLPQVPLGTEGFVQGKNPKAVGIVETCPVQKFLPELEPTYHRAVA